MGSNYQRSSSKSIRIVSRDNYHHTDGMKLVDVSAGDIRRAIIRRIKLDPKKWENSSPQDINALVDICVAALETAADSRLGIQLPPRPDVLFKDRAEKYGEKISVEEFIKLEIWGRAIALGVLSSDFILNGDQSLYKALNYQAKINKMKPSDYMESLGIITRRQMLNPSPELLQRIKIIRAAQVDARSRVESASAKSFEDRE
jgi:hypothetical protein